MRFDKCINLFNKCLPRADEIAPGLSDLIHIELEYLCNNWPKNLPTGIIHADLFPDNVFFENVLIFTTERRYLAFEAKEAKVKR